jgi:hypothetical protein
MLQMKFRDTHSVIERSFEKMIKAIPWVEVFLFCWTKFIAIIQWFNSSDPDVCQLLSKFGMWLVNLAKMHTWTSVVKLFSVYATEHMAGTFRPLDWYESLSLPALQWEYLEKLPIPSFGGARQMSRGCHAPKRKQASMTERVGRCKV